MLVQSKQSAASEHESTPPENYAKHAPLHIQIKLALAAIHEKKTLDAPLRAHSLQRSKSALLIGGVFRKRFV
jgi:hypothetical protein